MKYDKKKKFQTTKKTKTKRGNRNISKKNKLNKNKSRKDSKREKLIKARNLFASIEEHTLL